MTVFIAMAAATFVRESVSQSVSDPGRLYIRLALVNVVTCNIALRHRMPISVCVTLVCVDKISIH